MKHKLLATLLSICLFLFASFSTGETNEVKEKSYTEKIKEVYEKGLKGAKEKYAETVGDGKELTGKSKEWLLKDIENIGDWEYKILGFGPDQLFPNVRVITKVEMKFNLYSKQGDLIGSSKLPAGKEVIAVEQKDEMLTVKSSLNSNMRGSIKVEDTNLNEVVSKEMEKKLNELGKERWQCYWVESKKEERVFYFKRTKMSYLSKIPTGAILRILADFENN